MSPPSAELPNDLRAAMPVAERWAFFDHAAVAPLSGPCRTAMDRWTQDVAENGDVYWSSWMAELEGVRNRAAALVHADPEEIALVPNTTSGLNLVAQGFRWRPGENVVYLSDDFPSNVLPWQRLDDLGVEARGVAAPAGRLNVADVEAACDHNTRIVAVGWVDFASGYRNDLDALAEIAHRHGAMLCVDAIQGLGVLPLDVRTTPLDFFSADGHKWLLAPEGAGLFFIRRSRLDRLRPLGVGWHSVTPPGDFDRRNLPLAASAARFEGGSFNMAGFLGLGASLDLLARFGVATLAQRIDAYSEHCHERLRQAGFTVASDRAPERRTGILSLDMPLELARHALRICRQQGVVVNLRRGRLRISPHAYNDEADLDRLLDALRLARS